MNLPRSLTQVLWRDRAEERKERRGGSVPGFQLCHASSCPSVSALRHPVSDAGHGEEVYGAVGVVAQVASEALHGAIPLKRPTWPAIQQIVPHGPDHDLLLRAKTQLNLYGVDGVSDGSRLDFPCLRNRVV